MAQQALTPEEYELHLKDLRQRLRDLLERGEGREGELLKDAERVLSLSGDFPEVYARYGDVPGLVGELLARDKQRRYMAFNTASESPGCLVGWLARRKRR